MSSGKRQPSCLGINVLTQVRGVRGGDQALNFLNCVARNHGTTSYETITTLNIAQNTFFSYLKYSLVVILTHPPPPPPPL